MIDKIEAENIHVKPVRSLLLVFIYPFSIDIIVTPDFEAPATLLADPSGYVTFYRF